MVGKGQLGALIACAAVLFAAFAIGVGIRTFRMREHGSSRPPVQSAAGGSAPVGHETHDADEDTEQIMQWLDEEAAQAEAVDEDGRSEEPVAQEESSFAAVDSHDSETAAAPQEQIQGLPGWRQVWTDLNLTEAEQARLREGLSLMWQRWQSMSPQDQQAERQRLSAMRQRWEAMSDDERQQASRRMRDRFEEWRHSDRVELPELSLD